MPVMFLPGSVMTRRTVRVVDVFLFLRPLASGSGGKVMSRSWSPRISPHLRPVSDTSRRMGWNQRSMAAMTASLWTGVTDRDLPAGDGVEVDAGAGVVVEVAITDRAGAILGNQDRLQEFEALRDVVRREAFADR